MELGNDRESAKLDEQRKEETATLEQSLKEGHVEEERHQQDDGDLRSGHRIAGSGSSADEYPYKDHGEKGGASHPKPKEKD